MHRITRVFKSGNSLAVRIPKSFHITDQQEVEIFLKNNEIIIRIIPKNLADALISLIPFPDDVFEQNIDDAPPQKRDF